MGCGVSRQRPRHQRYVTARSYTDLTGADARKDDVPLSRVDAPESSRFIDSTGDRQTDGFSPTSTTGQKHELAPPHLPTSTSPSEPLTTHPPSAQHRTTHPPSTPLLPFPTHNPSTNPNTPTASPLPPLHNQTTPLRTTQHHRHRSCSDAHPSSSRSTKLATSHRSTRRDTHKTRYDAQIAELLLLLHDKVLQLENSIGHSLDGDRSYSLDGSVKMGKRKSKLGYTLPDIVAWQAGLGGGGNENVASWKVG